MATLFPNVNLSGLLSLAQLLPSLNTNFQAGNTALGERVVGHRVTLTGYAATGSTTTKMTIGSTSPPGSVPWAVLLVRVRETNNPGGDLPVTTRLNFTQSGDTLYVYEPAGLTLNTQYTLDFLVLE